MLNEFEFRKQLHKMLFFVSKTLNHLSQTSTEMFIAMKNSRQLFERSEIKTLFDAFPMSSFTKNYLRMNKILTNNILI